jgi:hypothetical protein
MIFAEREPGNQIEHDSRASTCNQTPDAFDIGFIDHSRFAKLILPRPRLSGEHMVGIGFVPVDFSATGGSKTLGGGAI